MSKKLVITLVLLSCCWQAYAGTTPAAYPTMAPVQQYMMERNAEIVLARSAAPDSISRDADVFVLGARGYELAAKGSNGFVCVVERSWTADADDPDFWNPKLRGPICFNAPAARSYFPIAAKKSEFVLAGMSKEQMLQSIKTSFDKKDLPAIEPGSMCYMMSRHAYLGDANGHWHPHLMFFLPQTPDSAWGAGSPGSPVVVDQDVADHLTVFMVPVEKWSDGTPEHPDGNSARHSHQL